MQKTLEDNMIKEFMKIIDDFEKRLHGKKEMLEVSIQYIMNEISNNKNTYAISFICKDYYSIIHIKFVAFDNCKKKFYEKDIVFEMNESLFSKKLQEREIKLQHIYKEDKDYGNFQIKYKKEKHEKIYQWLKFAWNKEKTNYNEVPRAYFMIGDFSENKMKYYIINLNEKEQLSDDEKMELINLLKNID